jgi:hypothetical protein
MTPAGEGNFDVRVWSPRFRATRYRAGKNGKIEKAEQIRRPRGPADDDVSSSHRRTAHREVGVSASAGHSCYCAGIRMLRTGETMIATTLRVFAFALLVSGCQPGVGSAQERFPRVQYVAGRPELLKPTDVTLVLDDRELRAEQTVYLGRGSSVRTVFSIPLINIIAVGASARGEAADLILPGPSGVSSPLTHEAYVTLTLRSGDRIDAILFKVERQESAGIAAKIESAADRALAPPIPQPAKARTVRSRSRPLHLVRVVGRLPTSPRAGFRPSRTPRRSRGAAAHGSIEWT